MKTILVDAIHAFVIKDEWIFQPMYKLLESYPNRKIILTNANDEEILKFGLDKMPYEVFTLKHTPNKPDPEYYRAMLEKFALDPKEVIHFENDIAAVTSARAVGIDTYHYDKEAKDIVALKNFIESHL